MKRFYKFFKCIDTSSNQIDQHINYSEEDLELIETPAKAIKDLISMLGRDKKVKAEIKNNKVIFSHLPEDYENDASFIRFLDNFDCKIEIADLNNKELLPSLKKKYNNQKIVLDKHFYSDSQFLLFRMTIGIWISNDVEKVVISWLKDNDIKSFPADIVILIINTCVQDKLNPFTIKPSIGKALKLRINNDKHNITYEEQEETPIIGDDDAYV